MIGATVVALLLLFSQSRAEVYVESNYDLDPLADAEANFGPQVLETGVEGLLRVADPENGCSSFGFVDFERPWVALVARQQDPEFGICTFDVKVRYAQDAGAVAVIVYDDIYESLIIMSMPPGHVAPMIPAVFISERSGCLLKKLLQLDPSVKVTILPVSDVEWVSLLMIAFLILLALTVALSTFYVMRLWSLWLGAPRDRPHAPAVPVLGRRSSPHMGLSAALLHSLPVLVFESHDLGARKDTGSCSPLSVNSSECEAILPAVGSLHAGETKRVCIVCLEQYSEGEKIRVLPCYHRFHLSCIDQWLGSRSCCPVCKWDANESPIKIEAETSVAPAPVLEVSPSEDVRPAWWSGPRFGWMRVFRTVREAHDDAHASALGAASAAALSSAAVTDPLSQPLLASRDRDRSSGNEDIESGPRDSTSQLHATEDAAPHPRSGSTSRQRDSATATPDPRGPTSHPHGSHAATPHLRAFSLPVMLSPHHPSAEPISIVGSPTMSLAGHALGAAPSAVGEASSVDDAGMVGSMADMAPPPTPQDAVLHFASS